MTKEHRILNTTKQIRMKFSQAERAVESCSAAWVEYGVSIRDLTIAEAIVARNQQASQRDPIAEAELKNIVFKHPGARAEAKLAWQANEFVARVM